MDFDALRTRTNTVRLSIRQPGAAPCCVGTVGPVVEWQLHKPAILPAILKHPGEELGTSYVRGDWDVDPSQLPRLLEALLPQDTELLHRRHRLNLPGVGFITRMDTDPSWQTRDEALAYSCLGTERIQYCGWFSEPGISLEEAQRRQRRRLMDLLHLQPGQQLLDINAGWGALAVWLAEQADIQVTAMVSTAEQLQFAQQLARERGVAARVRFRAGDIYSCRGQYDRVLATAFSSHRAESRAVTLAQHMRSLIRDTGFAWLQLVTRCYPGGLSNRWLERQTGLRNLPLFSEFVAGLETTGLRPLMLEDRSEDWLGTLEHRARRYQRQRDGICARFGAALTRHWEFTLASQVNAMRAGELSCHDLVLGSRCGNRPRSRSRTRPQGAGLDEQLSQTLASLTRNR